MFNLSINEIPHAIVHPPFLLTKRMSFKWKKIIFIALLFQLESLKETQNIYIKNASQKSKKFFPRRKLIFHATLKIYCEANEIYNSNAGLLLNKSTWENQGYFLKTNTVMNNSSFYFSFISLGKARY